MAILQELHRTGLTVILVTHEPDIARYAERMLMFRDGRLVGDERGHDLQVAGPALGQPTEGRAA